MVCYNSPRKLTSRPSPVTAPLSDRGHPLVGLRHAAGQRPGSLGEPRVGELWQRGARSHALGKAKRGTCSLVPEMRLRCYSSSFVMEKTEPADDEIPQLCLHSVSGGARGGPAFGLPSLGSLRDIQDTLFCLAHNIGRMQRVRRAKRLLRTGAKRSAARA